MFNEVKKGFEIDLKKENANKAQVRVKEIVDKVFELFEQNKVSAFEAADTLSTIRGVLDVRFAETIHRQNQTIEKLKKND